MTTKQLTKDMMEDANVLTLTSCYQYRSSIGGNNVC